MNAINCSPELRGSHILRSECPTCPPWVVRCAHFEGIILALSKTAEPSIPADCTHYWLTPAGIVVVTVDGYEPCPCGCGLITSRKVFSHKTFALSEEAAALAAFHAAEAELLRADLPCPSCQHRPHTGPCPVDSEDDASERCACESTAVVS